MDAERIAGYQGTGYQDATGRQGAIGYQEAEHQEQATTTLGAAPQRRGEHAGQVGAPGRPGDPGQPVRDFDAAAADRIDVRCEPLAVRDGCSPDRIPAGRWPSDGALVRSEQFAVNEGVAQPDGSVLAMHAPPGTGVAEVFGDMVAAIITERARRIADLPNPAAAFGESHTWSAHRVAAPNPALAGFEIVLAAPEPSALTAHGLPSIGARWREAAATIDYFASTARLADGVGAWAMLAARLGDGAANRAFAERWWRGAIRGTDVLFPAGESMAAALWRLREDSAALDWPAAVAKFRSALARIEALVMERAEVAAAVTRISDLEQACEEASGSAEAAQARLAELAAREPAVRDALTAAEEEHRVRLADLGAHLLDRPALATVTEQGISALRSRGALSVAVAGGVRRGRNWRTWSARRGELRAACAQAKQRREAAAGAVQALSASLAVAWTAVGEAVAEVARITAEIGPLAEAVALARQRWGDHVPDGPSQAETEDAALIEWRETSAPWADEEFAAARAEVFLAALDLHKTLIAARADVFAGNLGALMELLCADRALVPAQAAPAGATETVPASEHAAAGAGTAAAGAETAAAIAAAWQSLFLVVPVVHVPFGAIGPLFAGLGPTPLGWLLADHAERLPAWQARAILGRIGHAVLAGDTASTVEAAFGAGSAPTNSDPTSSAPAEDSAFNGDGAVNGCSAQWIAERTARYGTWLPASPTAAAESAEPAGDAGRIWVGTPLRVVRGLDRATVNLHNDLAYDGLLVSDRD
jgi:hypothetical protein